ncbi:hypothetical protein ACR82Z_04750 [Mycoplasma sp. 6243]|uniref:hypothetical protein n=1 Tax=Mycoplasma sp. 6243 TaxID=3440865 RepID=UPI003EC0950A
MASYVTAKCNKCGRTSHYIFGFSEDLRLFDLFLSEYKKVQKDLFKEEEFYKYFNDLFNKDIVEYQKLTDQEKNDILKHNYQNILNFFWEEEIKMIKKNILTGYELELYPVVILSKPKEERDILNVPLLKVKFLDGSEYNRRYNPQQSQYVQFSKDQKLLTCPYELKLTAENINEEER